MVAVGVDLDRSRRAVALAHRHDQVWAAVGHYPLEPAELDLDALRELATDPRVVAIGEIGLDFEHVGGIAKEVQVDRFDQLLTMARELDLPVSVHNRGADYEVESAIRRHRGLRGVMHYFALDWDHAQAFLAVGFYLSFAGLVTRPSRGALREVVKRCPEDRLLLETDSPYGNAQKRMGVPNRPAYLIDTAELVAQLRGVTTQQVAELESANAFALFRGMR